ncbi:MAG: type II toxin-antitoxin system VapC family toxin [Candidatus Pseudobacter hemicellulosilyticus]|uniref:Type II toxin-antitoxin system VapC family toxin n=1 Tax=Candidatus Pseudobacter hemicellulosilyticus TaxID=3121375 RepID=A0AAJ5WTR8_9BACT|nr:MAG: type II toxin-antitoxin system VapC family toxin [Pseudobacter sp.]
MKYLIDTHTFIWYINGERGLSRTAFGYLENQSTEKYVSIVSLWEIAIKFHLGRLRLKMSFIELENYAQTRDLTILPVKFKHICRLLTLPHLHRDPFDRFLISQAFAEELVLISKDTRFAAYQVPTIW